MGKLTTHVLDTARGRPAAGLALTLWRVEPGPPERLVLLRSDRTNADGRVDRPLLEGDELVPGVYELRFEVADWHAANGTNLASPAFLGTVPLRFGLADASAHYHVPLLVSPYGYSTYRGS